MVLGDHIQVHKSTVCRVIKTVSIEIARLRPHFIQFPSSVAEQQKQFDGGYPCRNYLLTALLNPRTDAERKYQKAQIGSRNVVERLFEVLKRRFPVLAVGVHTKLSTTMATIVATAVLYNFLLKEKYEIPPEVDNHVIDIELLQEIPTLPIHQLGNAERSHLINTVFS
ncbi:uncharacterized protein LOC126553645 [Aphis gossypii]|uniref:uncharacterized protein LOC126553645 n=1 Tax=Aphis gossypii TaxID=80765 RepID=UPI0021592EFC|nr:uncharacterized protein LOC126553645 [Aphis gossypii]